MTIARTRILALGAVALLASALWLSMSVSAHAQSAGEDGKKETPVATEAKPTEAKPTKPSEVKPTEAKPEETKKPKATATKPRPTKPQKVTPTATPQVATSTPMATQPGKTPHAYPTITPTPKPMLPNAGSGIGPGGPPVPVSFVALAGLGMILVIIAGSSLKHVREIGPAQVAEHLPAKQAARMASGEQVGTGWMILAGTIALATTLVAVALSKKR